MLSLGDIRAAVSLAMDIVKYVQSRPTDMTSSAVLDSLRTIYFEPETVRMLQAAMATNGDKRQQLFAKLSRRLLDVRYQVHRSLIVLEDEGFRDALGLKAKRLFDDISRGKVEIRNSLLLAINSSDLDMASVQECLTEIVSLNEKIETVDEMIRSAERNR